jgi:redox-sensitive bicupin YhaK (pirin superfamily)
MKTAETEPLLQRSEERAYFNHGWLETYHSFSFADYMDPKNIHWGALRVFNDDVVAGGQGFGTHAHRDMEILTYVFAGALEHRDSMGNIGVVRPGGVQYLSAGTGIQHSEYNHSKTEPCRLVQMWVLPQAAGLKPRYGQVDFTLADRQNGWLTIASGRDSVESQIRIWQDAACFVSSLENAHRDIAIDPDRYGFLFVGTGNVTVTSEDGYSADLKQGDALRIAGTKKLAVQGSGELVMWDIPQVR